MGGKSADRSARLARGAIAALLALGVAACDTDPPDALDNVMPADAYIAIVEWQVNDQEPVLDDNGDVVVPVVFVVAEDGTTIDVGVQAQVAEATTEWATVRFADQPSEAFNPDVDGEPVRDDGVMLLVGAIPDPAPAVEVSVTRYTSVDDSETLLVRLTATPGPANTSAVSPKASVVSVASVPQP